MISKFVCSRWMLRTCLVFPKPSVSAFRDEGGTVVTSKLRRRWPEPSYGFMQSDITLCRTGEE